ncbi:MAG: carboxylating nicotinate-nucleotide diphosphorylase [Actinobacteria bacterium]|nr:carboxylating nicotinate-nucleotide diphosphorylase [Actinomycetota bacterium]
MGVTLDLAEEVRSVVAAALAEDIGTGDVTTEAVVPAEARSRATVVLREPGVVCGLDAVGAAFAALDPGARLERLAADGDLVEAGPVARVEATARAILTAERTALNILGRLSGIATATRRHVDAIAGTGAVVLDTRKTTPGLRRLEKHAVRCGGGVNHRFGLADGVLVKDNHLLAVPSIAEAVKRLRASTALPIKVECDTLDQVDEALAAGADALLLDNMTLADLREAVRRSSGRARLEASGGITLDTIRQVAETGVDEISVGALTHSSRSLDVSLEVS